MAKKHRPKKAQQLTQEQQEELARQKLVARDARHLQTFRQYDTPEARARVPSNDAACWFKGIDATRVDLVRLGVSQRQALLRAPNLALRAYRFRKMPLLSEDEYLAGLRLYLDHEETQLVYGMTSDPAREPTSGSLYRDFTPNRLDAENRLRSALLDVHGIGRVMVTHVCCEAKPLSEGQFPPYTDGKKKMARFKEALEDLIRHYKKYPDA